MAVYRLYAEIKITENSRITIKGKEFHHLHNVLRLQIGEKLEIINGQGQLGRATLAALSKEEAIAKIEKVIEEPVSSFPIILLQALPRMDRLETIVEKGTELGMTHLWLFPGELSEKKKLTPTVINRLELKAIAATKQCDRLYLPQIEIKPPLVQWERPSFSLFFGDLEEEAPGLIHSWHQTPPQNGILFAIGPESGFSNNELAILKRWKARGVRLHRNVLRTETAALVALSIIEQLR